MHEGTPGSTVAASPPWIFFLLGRATAMLQGFLQVVFPYVAVHYGVSVAAVASIIAAANLAIPLKLFWTPLLDMAGTLRGWVVIGGILTMALLVVLILAPIDAAGVPLLLVLAFVASTAAQVAGSATGGLLVLTVARPRLGEASSYLQGGDLLLQGICGGAGLWVATGWGLPAAAACFAIMILPTFLMVALVAEPVRAFHHVGLARRAAMIGAEVVEMARDRRRLWVMLAFVTPIGAGCASYLWAAIAPEWHASAGQVAAITGLGAAFSSALGAFVYGRFFDRFDRSVSFLGTGILLVVAALVLVVLPRSPVVFLVGTMFYAAMLGFSWTAFGALQYETVGGGAAATKNAVLNAIGNMPITYMPVLLGLVHDRWSTTVMLLFEAGTTSVFILAFMLARPHGAARSVPGAPVVA